MKKILRNNNKTKELLDKLPKVYMISCWARWGVSEFPFVKLDKQNQPLVYKYDDHNGIVDQYELIPLRFASSAGVWDWTFNEDHARKIAAMFNERDGLKI